MATARKIGKHRVSNPHGTGTIPPAPPIAPLASVDVPTAVVFADVEPAMLPSVVVASSSGDIAFMPQIAPLPPQPVITASIEPEVVIRVYAENAVKPRYVVFNPHNSASMLTNAFGKVVVEALLSDYGATLDAAAVQAIIARRLGRAVPLAPVSQMLEVLNEARITKEHNEVLRQTPPLIRRIGFSLYVRLFDLNRMLRPTKLWWWHPALFMILFAIGVGGLIAAASRYTLLGSPIPGYFSMYHLPAYAVLPFLVINYIIIIAHELSHALPCVKHGVKVGYVGAIIGALPGVFTDTNGVYLLPTRRSRLMVSLAGPLTTLAMTGYLGYALAVVPSGTPAEIFLFSMIIWTLITLLICLNPFGHDDGYFILTEIIHEPNLRGHALAHVFARLRGIALPQVRRPRFYWVFVVGYALSFGLTLAMALLLFGAVAQTFGWQGF